MAQYQDSYPAGRQSAGRESTASTNEDVSFWAVGLTLFASGMMLMVGFFHIIEGFTAVLDDSFYVVQANYPLGLDVTTWGWLQIIGGFVVMIAGGLLLRANILSRILVIGIAVLSAIGSFVSIPYYPAWSILLIAIDISIIWAVTSYARFVKEA